MINFVKKRGRFFSQAIIFISIAISFVVSLVISITLYFYYEDAWDDTRHSAENVLQATSREILQNMSLYDHSIKRAVRIIEEKSLTYATSEIRKLALFDSSLIVNGLVSLTIIGRDGKIIESSSQELDPGLDFSDCPDFRIHALDPDRGTYLNQFCQNQVRNSNPSFSLSRRISSADGSFYGIVLAEISLLYIRNSFERLDLGKNGAVFLASGDGFVLMRHPSTDNKGNIGFDFSKSPAYAQMRGKEYGSFKGTAMIDSVDRFYTFSRVGEWPLIVVVAISVESVMSNWYTRTIAISGMTFLLCLGIISSSFIIRGEVLRRERVEADLERLSRTDSLTGLFNRRYFDEIIERELETAKQTRGFLAFLMVDTDHFKKLNDQFGHLYGDQVLIGIAKAIRNSIRHPGDFAARYGGDEFAIIMPGMGPEQAIKVARRIQTWLAENQTSDLTLLRRSDHGAPISVSIGVTSVIPSWETTVEDLIDMTDKALYRVKKKGRNHIEFTDA